MPSSGLRVVVTGATGNVGLAVVKALVAEPGVEHIVGVARRAPRLDAAPYDDAKFSWKSADVGIDPLDGIVDGADAVIHLAWRFQPTRDHAVTWRSNVIGTERVVEAAGRAGVGAVVYASSVGAYSPVAGQPYAGPAGESLAQRDQPVDESWPTRALPSAAYGIEKSYLERYLDGFEATHPDVRVVRTRNAFVFHTAAAPEQLRIFGGRLAPARLVGSRRIPVLPVPAGLRFQAIHGDDLAGAVVQMLLRPVRGAFNLAADPVVGPEQLAELFRARVIEIPPALVRGALGAAFRLRLVPVEPGLLELFMTLPVMDSTRAHRELDWTPRHSSLDALGELLDGLRAPVGGPTPPLAG
jgi:nucleoside-diphosphate-sugar epimerase